MMRTLLRLLWGLLAWAWLVCTLLTLLELTDTIGFATPQVGITVRAATWLLVIPFSSHFGISRRLGCGMWAALVGSVGLGVLTFFLGGFVILYFVGGFFFGHGSWYTTLVHTSWGIVRYVRQGNGPRNERDIVLLPVTPWLNVPLPPTWFDVQHWTPVHKSFAYFGPDSAKQGAEDRRAYHFIYCTQQTNRLDSLNRLHLLPAQALPPATQQGAGTLGCVLGQQVWCSPLRPAPEPTNCATAWAGAWRQFNGTTYFGVHVSRIHESLSIHLPYPLPREIGRWPASLWVTWASQSDGKRPATLFSAPHTVVVTITRLDTVAHVISGTFAGTLYRYRSYPAGSSKSKALSSIQLESIPVSQGRFDLPYEPGMHYETP